ncbi:MAG TPA: CHAT domain-containing protein [Caulobacteraceae bacterium]|jgi:CHAT domain-containing protein
MSARGRLIGALASVSLALPAASLAAGDGTDFALGVNAESQACRAVARFDAPAGAKSADIYCGAWEAPSGRVTVYANDSQAAAGLANLCKGDATSLQGGDFTGAQQIACGRSQTVSIRRYALVAHHGGKVIVGEVFPSDWAPLMNAARVLTGLERASAVPATAVAGQTPGLQEIQAVFPNGAPGQAAASNYELLRRRAYEYNVIWDFGTSLRDFETLMAAQRKVAPDDAAGEADILAEIGLNMSSARRFDDAAATLDKAEALGKGANDPLLLTKITNYRAIDQLNQRHFDSALRLSLAAGEARAQLQRAAGPRSSITAGDVSRVESHSASAAQRGLLIQLTDARPADRAAILSAQGFYIAGVAAQGLGQPAAAANYLDSASAWLDDAAAPPAWLVGDVADERADVALARGDFAGAASIASSGIVTIKTVAPGSRSEAHLWLALEAARAGQGQMDDALVAGRGAIGIFSKQTESPGLPPDVAAPHLALLEQAWRKSGDAKLGDEYFEDLALVWDGAAARTTAQLAARLVLRSAGDEARIYQDAERSYRATYARREQLAADPNTPKDQVTLADAAAQTAAAGLAKAEADLREKAPTYLELLNPGVATADLQSVLGDHEAYLRIAMASDGGYGALVDKAGVHPFRISATAEQVDALADRIRRSTHLKGRLLPDYDIDAAQTLYAALLGPVQAQLAGVQDLDIDVSGSLASVPFTALVATSPTQAQVDKIKSDQDYSGVDWLARHMSVANALGPASFVRLRKAPPSPSVQLKAAVYGDYQPNPGLVAQRLAEARGLTDACRASVEHVLTTLGPLPDTAGEAKGVAASFSAAHLALGARFTDTSFMQDPATGDADVIMLATHGVLGLSPCFPEPALLTSVGDGGSGLIEASRLLDRQLRASLVVLSACDTAAGGKLDEANTGLADGGDALSGLARAFIYAGARNVLATEWKVDSAASQAEVTKLLAGVNQPGESVRGALTKAESSLYDQAETGHPFYWAAFVLVGDGGGVLRQATVASATPPMVGGRPAVGAN